MSDTLAFFGEAPAQDLGPSPLVDITAVEKVEGWDNVWVKREDESCPDPGPCFSKIRGVYARIASRPEKLIGVLDTYHSKAGWAVAYICSLLGKECINFYPKYKADEGEPLREQQERAVGFGAELVALKAGRSAILFHTAKKQTRARGGYMMPNALKLEETVGETANEVARTPGLDAFDHLIISISSATIASGVLKGFDELGHHPKVWLHMGYERSESAVTKYMKKYHPNLPFDITFINEKYGYKDQARTGDYTPPPFPCNPYYDLKAWRWMDREGLAKMDGKVLFWNIGS